MPAIASLFKHGNFVVKALNTVFDILKTGNLAIDECTTGIKNSRFLDPIGFQTIPDKN